MTKISVFIVIFVVFVTFLTTSNGFSLRLPHGAETYLKALAVTKSPELTTTTTAESVKTESQSSCWQDFSVCYSFLYNFITEQKID